MVSRLPPGQHRVITEESNLPCAYALAIWSPELGCMDGQSLVIIGKLLGHSQPATTARYAHLADDPVKAARKPSAVTLRQQWTAARAARLWISQSHAERGANLDNGRGKLGELELEKGPQINTRHDAALAKFLATPPRRDQNNRWWTSFMYSILGTVLSLCVFAGVWVLGYAAFTVFDQLRGLDSPLQMLFRELIVPGAAGYLGNSIAAALLPKSKVKFIFYAFASVLLVAAGLSIWFVLPFAERIGELTFSVVWGQLTILAGVVGAYVFARDHLYEKLDRMNAATDGGDVSEFDFSGMTFSRGVSHLRRASYGSYTCRLRREGNYLLIVRAERF